MKKQCLDIDKIVQYIRDKKIDNLEYFMLVENKKTKDIGCAVVTQDNRVKVFEGKDNGSNNKIYFRDEIKEKYTIKELVEHEEYTVSDEEMKSIMKEWVLVEDIKGNRDLHLIAKNIKFENGTYYLPKTITRKKFILELIGHIKEQLVTDNFLIEKNILTQELKRLTKIWDKEKKKTEFER